MYAIASLARTEDGSWAPRLPSNSGFLEIACPGGNRHWALYSVDVNYPVDPPKGFQQVQGLLRAAMDSAEGYPPAFALAREALRSEQTNPATRRGFLLLYERLLRQHLADQPSSRYFLAEAQRDEPGYLTRGDFVWIVGYAPATKIVRWVSSDYHVYANHLDFFDIETGLLSRVAQ